jgi:hypothetical protein
MIVRHDLSTFLRRTIVPIAVFELEQRFQPFFCQPKIFDSPWPKTAR